MNKAKKEELFSYFVTIQVFLFLICLAIEFNSPILIGPISISLLYITYFLLFTAIASTKSWLYDPKKSQTRSQ